MSAPIKQYNTQRALPPIPAASPNKPPSESTNVPALNLPNIVPKDSARSLSERPQLPEPTENPEGQTSAPTKPPPPLPRRAMVLTTPRTESDQISPSSSNVYSDDVDSPSSIQRGMPLAETVRPKVERLLTVSPAGKRPIFKSPPKLASKEQKNSSPPFSPTYSSNPETLSPFDEQDMAKYDQGFDKFAAELEDEFVDEFAGVLDFEIKTAEKSARNKSESNNPKKKSAKSSKLAASLDRLRIDAREFSVRNQSGPDSPEKKRMRLDRLRTVSRATPMQRRTPRENASPSITAIQNNPTDPDSESKTSNAENN